MLLESHRLERTIILDFNLIESVQRRATKMVSSLRQFSNEDGLQKLNIPTMKFRRATGDLIEVYKHLHFYDKSAIENRFVSHTCPSQRYGQESQRHFAEDGFKGVQSNSFYFRSIKPWNNLPRNMVDSPSIHVFKKRLNEHLKSQKFVIKMLIKPDSKRSNSDLYFYNNNNINKNFKLP